MKNKYYYDFEKNLNCEENCFIEKNKEKLSMCETAETAETAKTAETAETADPFGFAEGGIIHGTQGGEAIYINANGFPNSYASTTSNLPLNSMPSDKDMRIPSYYIGRNGYEARKVVANFDLSYNIGTATTYLLRCGKKKENGMSDKDKHIEDINKAINHLKFEISKLHDEK